MEKKKSPWFSGTLSSQFIILPIGVGQWLNTRVLLPELAPGTSYLYDMFLVIDKTSEVATYLQGGDNHWIVYGMEMEMA